MLVLQSQIKVNFLCLLLDKVLILSYSAVYMVTLKLNNIDDILFLLQIFPFYPQNANIESIYANLSVRMMEQPVVWFFYLKQRKKIYIANPQGLAQVSNYKRQHFYYLGENGTSSVSGQVWLGKKEPVGPSLKLWGSWLTIGKSAMYVISGVLQCHLCA